MRSIAHAVRIAGILAAIACFYTPTALAQWSPLFAAGLGRGVGNFALSESILSNARRLGGSAAADASLAQAAPVPTTPAQTQAMLTYTPDQLLSDRTRAAMIDALSQQNPHLREEMAKAFAGNAVLKEFDRIVSAHGYTSSNVADDMAELLLTSWELATGGVASKAQIQGAHLQVRDLFLNTPEIRVLTNADRQEMAERIAYQVVIRSAARKEFLRGGNQAQLAQLRQSATATMLQQGIDLSVVWLTEQGFSRNF